MKSFGRVILTLGLILGGIGILNAQNSAPAPGMGGGLGGLPMGPGPVISAPGSPSGLGNGPAPAPGSGIYNPGPPPPPAPANPVWNGMSPLVVNTPLSTPNWQNNGTMTVMACGYDAQGVWRTIPLRISYSFNGAQYVVNVLAAWNPWTDMWNRGLDDPAYSTSYFLNGTTFNYYTNLSTGTFYFNL